MQPLSRKDRTCGGVYPKACLQRAFERRAWSFLMGASNIAAAFAMWGADLGPIAFKVFTYMCLVSKDSDEEPWFGMGHEALAIFALRRPEPITATDVRAVERAITELHAKGAIVTTRKASMRRSGQHTARYRLELGPAHARRKLSDDISP